MICEFIRGMACIGRMMEKVEEFLDENGFACDKATCFRDAPGLCSGLPDELDRT